MKYNTPIVSVIIPNYNTATYLADAVNSVYNTNSNNFEVIVVDDGSTDNTEDVISRYLDFPNFTFIKQENKGLSGARNTGIKASSGEYLVFLDSDDIILPDKLESQIKILQENQKYDGVYSSSVFYVDGKPEIKIATNFPNFHGFILNHLLYGNFIHVNALMIRKSALVKAGNFDESLRELEDWDLWLRMSLNGSLFYHQDQILSEVRLRKGSMTSDQLKMNRTMVKVLEKIIAIIKHSPYINNKTMFCAYEALLQYKLLAKERKGFNKQIKVAIENIGLGFIPTASKLFVKRYLSIMFNFKNRTTKRLANFWDE